MNKNVELVKEVPPRNDIKMTELISAVEALGFKTRNGKGSHVVITHKEQKELFTVVPSPHGGNNCVKKCYIKQIQELIKQLEE